MKNLLKKQDGAYSIETALVMIVVFMVILLLVVMSHIMYEQTRLNAIAQDAAERAGVIYSVAGKDMITARVDPNKFKDTTPYWRLIDFNQTSRKQTVENYVNMKLNAFKINPSGYTVNVEYKNYFIYKRVEVTIKTDYKIPFGGFLKLLMGNSLSNRNTYHIEATATASVNEQAEMIRNVDMVVDIASELGMDTSKYQTKIQEIADKITGK